MKTLIKALANLGLLKDDVDYHPMRGSMVLIFALFGYQKWFDYEAQTLILLSAMPFNLLDIPRFSASVGQVGSWEFQSGWLARCCCQDSGTSPPGFLAQSFHASHFSER